MFDREPGFAHTGRSHHSDQPLVREQLVQPAQFGVAAEECRQWAAGRPCLPTQQARILGEDSLFQFLQPGAGVGAEVVGQQFPDPAQCGERVALAVGAVQAEDE
jgi:hypothetical protein